MAGRRISCLLQETETCFSVPSVSVPYLHLPWCVRRVLNHPCTQWTPGTIRRLRQRRLDSPRTPRRKDGSKVHYDYDDHALGTRLIGPVQGPFMCRDCPSCSEKGLIRWEVESCLPTGTSHRFFNSTLPGTYSLLRQTDIRGSFANVNRLRCRRPLSVC